MRKPQILLQRCETVFLLAFMLYTFLGFNSVTFGSPVISVVMWFAYLLGAGLLLVRLYHWKHYIKMPGLVLLIAMCAICALSILVNRQYHFKMNVISLIFWAFYFLMYYAQDDRADPELVKKRFRLAGHLFCLCAFILTALSLLMMFTRYSRIVEINGDQIIRGFTHGRLYGAYRTPNAGAVIASIAIFLSVHFAARYKKPVYTIAAAVHILLQLLYIVFSDSRSGILCLAFGGAVYTLFAVISSKSFTNRRAQTAAALMLTALVLFTGIFGPGKVQDLYNSAVRALSEEVVSAPVQDETETAPTENRDQIRDQMIKDFVVDRGYDLSGDISNRRFAVWKSGLEIFARRPWLGTSFYGFTDYARENMPETYIVNNDYMDLTTLDNDFVNLLVSNGVFAFLAFVVFVAWVLAVLFRRIFTAGVPDAQCPAMMAVCMAGATFSMFTSGVLYMQSPFSALFWLSLGTLMVLARGNTGKTNPNEP